MKGTLEVTRLGRKARSLVDTGEPLSKVILRIGDGELEWELHYSVVVYVTDDLLSQRDDYNSPIVDFHFTFKLVPLSGLNFLETNSSSLNLDCQEALIPGSLSINTVYRCVFNQRLSFSRRNFCLTVRLAAGETHCQTVARGVPGHNISRLYNSDNLSDVVVRCGDMKVKAQKNILAAHSDTLRTVFSGNSYLEVGFSQQSAQFRKKKDFIKLCTKIVSALRKFQFRKTCLGCQVKFLIERDSPAKFLTSRSFHNSSIPGH